MNEHADLELIAAFREGLLNPADGDRVGRHLSGCAACALRQAALADVTARLAQAPQPPMPPGLARRLDAVLAAEVAAADTAAGTTAAATTAGAPGEQPQQRARHGRRAARARALPGSADRDAAGRAPASGGPAGRELAGRGPGRRERAGRERERHGLMAIALRPLAAAASVCVLAGGGYLLVRSFTHTSATPSIAATSNGRQQSAKSGATLSPRRPMDAPQAPGASSAAVFVSSHTRYLPGQLRTQAAAVARRYAREIPSPGKAGYTTVQPFGTNPSLSGCLQRVTDGRGGLVVDTATYEGRPATVIIAPGTGGVGGRVWVVGHGCSASTSDVLARSGL